MGIEVPTPLQIYVDATSAISFQRNTCVDSALRGTFDLREEWVAELRDQEIVKCSKVPALNNISDLGTKCHVSKDWHRLVNLIQSQD